MDQIFKCKINTTKELEKKQGDFSITSNRNSFSTLYTDPITISEKTKEPDT